MKGRIKSAKIRSGLVSSGELKPLIYMRSQVTIIRQLDESTIESIVLLKCLMGSNYQKETQQLKLLIQSFSNLNVHGSP